MSKFKAGQKVKCVSITDSYGWKWGSRFDVGNTYIVVLNVAQQVSIVDKDGMTFQTGGYNHIDYDRMFDIVNDIVDREVPPVDETLESILEGIYHLVDQNLQIAEIKALLCTLVDEHVVEFDELDYEEEEDSD